MRNRIAAGLALALVGAPAAAQDMLAGWTCSAREGSGHAVLTYDARRRLQVEESTVTWGTAGGPVRIAFGLKVTAPDRFLPSPGELRVLFDAPQDGPEPRWLEIAADARPLFAGPLVERTSDGSGLVFQAGAKGHGAIVSGAWSARSLKVRFLDGERRPLGDATFLLPAAERRSAPVSAAFVRARGRFADEKICTPRQPVE